MPLQYSPYFVTYCIAWKGPFMPLHPNALPSLQIRVRLLSEQREREENLEVNPYPAIPSCLLQCVSV